MCKYCERNNVKFITDMPNIPLKVCGNVLENEDANIQIFDYQDSQPLLLITQQNYFDGEGIGTIYIPIDYCPYCGRKLGKDIKYDKKLLWKRG